MPLPAPASPGQSLADVDTPALLLDLDAFERNLKTMADAVAPLGVRLRPHAKSHKCAEIARRQIAAGAVGVCVQKTSEAEALVAGGVQDVLIANEVVGRPKLARVAALGKSARVGVCVDDAAVVAALDEAALNWGVKVLRYEIKDLTPPTEILRSMQAQITAEREKRALIAASEGKRQEQINLAEGQRQAFIAKSEGERQSEINLAQGEAAAITAVAEATADAIRKIAAAIEQPGGAQAVQLKVAEKAVDAYQHLARTNNTMIVPGNMTEVAALIATAMALMKGGAKG